MKEHPDIVKFCHFPAYVRTQRLPPNAPYSTKGRIPSPRWYPAFAIAILFCSDLRCANDRDWTAVIPVDIPDSLGTAFERREIKNRPVATNFQFLKIFCPLGQLLVGACLPQTLLGMSTANGNYQRVMFFLNLAVYASFSSCSLIP